MPGRVFVTDDGGARPVGGIVVGALLVIQVEPAVAALNLDEGPLGLGVVVVAVDRGGGGGRLGLRAGAGAGGRGPLRVRAARVHGRHGVLVVLRGLQPVGLQLGAGDVEQQHGVLAAVPVLYDGHRVVVLVLQILAGEGHHAAVGRRDGPIVQEQLHLAERRRAGGLRHVRAVHRVAVGIGEARHIHRHDEVVHARLVRVRVVVLHPGGAVQLGQGGAVVALQRVGGELGLGVDGEDVHREGGVVAPEALDGGSARLGELLALHAHGDGTGVGGQHLVVVDGLRGVVLVEGLAVVAQLGRLVQKGVRIGELRVLVGLVGSRQPVGPHVALEGGDEVLDGLAVVVLREQGGVLGLELVGGLVGDPALAEAAARGVARRGAQVLDGLERAVLVVALQLDGDLLAHGGEGEPQVQFARVEIGGGAVEAHFPLLGRDDVVHVQLAAAGHDVRVLVVDDQGGGLAAAKARAVAARRLQYIGGVVLDGEVAVRALARAGSVGEHFEGGGTGEVHPRQRDIGLHALADVDGVGGGAFEGEGRAREHLDGASGGVGLRRPAVGRCALGAIGRGLS